MAHNWCLLKAYVTKQLITPLSKHANYVIIGTFPLVSTSVLFSFLTIWQLYNLIKLWENNIRGACKNWHFVAHNSLRQKMFKQQVYNLNSHKDTIWAPLPSKYIKLLSFLQILINHKRPSENAYSKLWKVPMPKYQMPIS